MADLNLGVGKLNITEAQLREVLKQEVKKADPNIADSKVDSYVDLQVKKFLQDGQISEDELQFIEDFVEEDAGIIQQFTVEPVEVASEEPVDTRSDFEKRMDAELQAAEDEAKAEEQAAYDAQVAKVRNENAIARANQIHAAAEGWGTDEKAIMTILSSVSDKELIEISNAYLELYGEVLQTRILKEFKGWFEGDERDLINTRFAQANESLQKAGGDVTKMDDGKTLEQLNEAKLISMADALHTAMKPDKWFGWGTDEEAVANTIYGADLTPEEWKKLDEIYSKKYGESLVDTIKGDFSGRTKKSYMRFFSSVGLIESGEGGGNSSSIVTKYEEGMTKEQIWEQKRTEEAKARAAEIHAAVDRAGTDEDALKRVLLDSKLTPEEIRNLASAYEEMYGESLIDAIKGDTSGGTKAWYVSTIENALNDNTKDPINLEKYGITDDTNPKDIAPDYNALCKTLYTATSARSGTDEQVIDQIIMQSGLTNDQIKELDQVYQNTYGKSLIQLMQEENSGTYGKTLVTRLKAAGLKA